MQEPVDSIKTDPTASRGQQNTLAELTAYFEQQQAIAAVYLFGSRATGQANHSSDYDIAILFTETPAAGELLSLRTDLVDITENLDLVILNQASPALRHQVFRYGKTLVLKNEQMDVQCRYRTFREYQDFLEFTGWANAR